VRACEHVCVWGGGGQKGQPGSPAALPVVHFPPKSDTSLYLLLHGLPGSVTPAAVTPLLFAQTRAVWGAAACCCQQAACHLQ
jgi:hypothetical protein